MRKRLTLDLRLDDIVEDHDETGAEDPPAGGESPAWQRSASFRELAMEAGDLVGRKVGVSVRDDVADPGSAYIVMTAESTVSEVRPSGFGWALTLAGGTEIYLDEDAYVRGAVQQGAFSATFGPLQIHVWAHDEDAFGGAAAGPSQT